MINLRRREKILILMGLLNVLSLGYLVFVGISTRLRITSSGSARGFLDLMTTVPAAPQVVIFAAGGCLVLLFACMYVKWSVKDISIAEMMLLSLLEIIFSVLVMAAVNMNYTGVILFVVAEMLLYIDQLWNRITVLVIALLLYVGCSYNLITILFPFNSMDMWVSYYSTDLENALLGMRTILEIINMVLFILYIVVITMEERQENIRITELNEQLHLANEQLHAYAQEKEQMGETRERNRLAREIHDTLGHILTGISVGVEAVKVLMDVAPDQAVEQLDTIGDMAKRGLNDVRRSVRKLKPDVLEDLPLDLAINQMLDNMQKSTKVKIYFVCSEKNIRYSTDEEEAIYRTIQEGTTNAIRHGQATEIWVKLNQKEQMVTLIISDNGKGCGDIKEGFGLRHIRERVELLGGEVGFESLGGFNIVAQIPIRQKKGEEL